jgi:hypothetical protein
MIKVFELFSETYYLKILDGSFHYKHFMETVANFRKKLEFFIRIPFREPIRSQYCNLMNLKPGFLAFNHKISEYFLMK